MYITYGYLYQKVSNNTLFMPITFAGRYKTETKWYFNDKMVRLVAEKLRISATKG